MLKEIVTEFRELVNELYGAFLDARDGFDHVRRHMIEVEEEAKSSYEDLKKNRPELAHIAFGCTEFSYCRVIPAGSAPRYRHLHEVPVEAVKRRNEDGGTNSRLIANICIVTLFQYWDEYYRGLLATALGVERKDIQVPLFGDLRRYRHAIVHNRGIATSELEGCEVFRWFKQGEPILLTRDTFEEIVDGIFEVLDVFDKNPERYVSKQT